MAPPLRFLESVHVEYAPMLQTETTYARSTASFFAPQLHSTPPKFPATNSADFYPDHKQLTISPPKSNHSAYIDLFSTPGPGYCTVPPVYFDSPAEDPSDSDPLEQPAYELNSLDFRWEPFIQNGSNQHDVVPAPQTPPAPAVSGGDDYYYETRVEPDGEDDDEDGQLYASINLEATSDERIPSPSQSRFSFVAPAGDLRATPAEPREQSQNIPGTPQDPDPPFFAPAGNIFISPLRGDQAPKTPLEDIEAAPDGENPCCSQTSNDTIEDWDC
ncbi:hypothetical protein B0H12DRAFT_319257 [Mycena haematopus]|nr:hypothetical protein B0H12DRAFT_319257 [Mycena haematopus]